MAARMDWPDARYGFWVALGVIAAFALVSMVRRALGAVTSRGRG